MWITVNCCGLLFLKRNLIEITIQNPLKIITKKPQAPTEYEIKNNYPAFL